MVVTWFYHLGQLILSPRSPELINPLSTPYPPFIHPLSILYPIFFHPLSISLIHPLFIPYPSFIHPFFTLYPPFIHPLSTLYYPPFIHPLSNILPPFIHPFLSTLYPSFFHPLSIHPYPGSSMVRHDKVWWSMTHYYRQNTILTISDAGKQTVKILRRSSGSKSSSQQLSTSLNKVPNVLVSQNPVEEM